MTTEECDNIPLYITNSTHNRPIRIIAIGDIPFMQQASFLIESTVQISDFPVSVLESRTQ